LEACIKAGSISEDNSVDYKKVGWSRCSRTDKRVHALVNIISLKMILQENDLEVLNSYLPSDIQ
jgi:tRNA pseudouridine38-40 synthase